MWVRRSLSAPPSLSPAAGVEQDPSCSAQETQALLLGRGWFPLPRLNHGLVQFSDPTALFPGEQETQGPAPLAQVGLLIPSPQKRRGRDGDCKLSPANSLASNSVRAPLAGGRTCPALHLWEPVFMEAKYLESPKMPQVVFIRPKHMCYGCFVNHVHLQPCAA